MSTSMRMEEDRSHMTERILNLTLEIIYLLTGESFPLLKSGDHVTITVPPCDSLKPERHNMEKILEVTKKMMELLTGEVPIRCQDGPVYVSMKKWESFEGHRDLYKDVMMEDQPPLTSPDGSSKRNPPERCPRPLYSRDSTQEDLTIPHHDQGEDLMKIKVEGEVEETYVRDDQQYTGTFIEEDGTTRTIKEEDTPIDISTGHVMEKPSKDRLTLSPGCKMEDEDITADCAGEETMSSAMDGHSVDRAWNPSDSEQPRPVGDGAGIQEKTFPCPECRESFTSESTLCVHLSSHMGDKFLYCYECGKCFLHKFELINHYRSHTGEKPYSCPECGRGFSQKFNLTKHQRSHTGEKPYFCSECGKYFSAKSALNLHQRLHTGEKPYSCTECGKSFSQKAHLASHWSLHTGERPFPCTECGKCFLHKSKLLRHYKSHMRKKSHSSPK